MPHRAFAFVALVALAGCATAPPLVPSPADQWRTDVDAYREKHRKLAANIDLARDDFKALTAEESFPGLEDKIASLSSRIVELEAAHAELESARLDLWLRRLSLAPVAESDAASDAALVAESAPPLFACPRYRVARIEFVSCR